MSLSVRRRRRRRSDTTHTSVNLPQVSSPSPKYESTFEQQLGTIDHTSPKSITKNDFDSTLVTEQPLTRRWRKRRTNTDSDPLSFELQTESSDPEITAPLTATLSGLATPIPQDQFNQIRDEIEAHHHAHLAGSDYWDDSHDWSDEGELVSDDYWHFLGRYE